MGLLSPLICDELRADIVLYDQVTGRPIGEIPSSPQMMVEHDLARILSATGSPRFVVATGEQQFCTYPARLTESIAAGHAFYGAATRLRSTSVSPFPTGVLIDAAGRGYAKAFRSADWYVVGDDQHIATHFQTIFQMAQRFVPRLTPAVTATRDIEHTPADRLSWTPSAELAVEWPPFLGWLAIDPFGDPALAAWLTESTLFAEIPSKRAMRYDPVNSALVVYPGIVRQLRKGDYFLVRSMIDHEFAHAAWYAANPTQPYYELFYAAAALSIQPTTNIPALAGQLLNQVDPIVEYMAYGVQLSMADRFPVDARTRIHQGYGRVLEGMLLHISQERRDLVPPAVFALGRESLHASLQYLLPHHDAAVDELMARYDQARVCRTGDLSTCSSIPLQTVHHGRQSNR